MTKNRLTPVLTAISVFPRLYRRAFKLFGRKAAQLAEPINLKTDLCLAQSTQRDQLYSDMALPDNLLQAFTSDPLTAGDMRFIGREEQSSRLLTAVELWRAGRKTMIAVTGPQGCGITSFLQQLPAQVSSPVNWHYSQLTRRPCNTTDTLTLLSEVVGCDQLIASVVELVDYINDLPPTVFVIDNGHFLACRIMGAHEAIRVFGAVMVATQQHLWVLGCQEIAWLRMAYIFHVDRYFSEHITLSLFNDTELGLCLSTRLQVSGITLNTGGITADQQSQPNDGLGQQLSTLYRLSNGKPDISFFYLLGSLIVHSESRQWDITPAIGLDFSLLKQLISEELFTLAELASHGHLTIDDHRSMFRCSREESWLLLEHLYQQCLLVRNDNADEPSYHLLPLYSDVISRFLTNANYLY